MLQDCDSFEIWRLEQQEATVAGSEALDIAFVSTDLSSGLHCDHAHDN